MTAGDEPGSEFRGDSHPKTAPFLVVTTSWDDGHRLDLRLAELLNRHQIAGTFYIAPRSVEVAAPDRLSLQDIRAIASGFEVGGHTLTHARLPLVSLEAASEEIRAGKLELEDAIQSPLRSFCYPRGEYASRHVEMVRGAGFSVARTVRRYISAFPDDLLQMGTTVNAYRHLKDVYSVGRCSKFEPVASATRFWNWDQLAMALFDRVLDSGGLFHFWGHSWEIDARGDWERLERVLGHIGRKSGARYVSNGELATDLSLTPSSAAFLERCPRDA